MCIAAFGHCRPGSAFKRGQNVAYLCSCQASDVRQCPAMGLSRSVQMLSTVVVLGTHCLASNDRAGRALAFRAWRSLSASAAE